MRAQVDIVFVGHTHNYQRCAPMDSSFVRWLACLELMSTLKHCYFAFPIFEGPKRRSMYLGTFKQLDLYQLQGSRCHNSGLAWYEPGESQQCIAALLQVLPVLLVHTLALASQPHRASACARLLPSSSSHVSCTGATDTSPSSQRPSCAGTGLKRQARVLLASLTMPCFSRAHPSQPRLWVPRCHSHCHLSAEITRKRYWQARLFLCTLLCLSLVVSLEGLLC
jgi:hypothetical protein